MSVPIPAPEILLDRYFLELRLVNWSAETIDRRSFSIGTFISWFRERDIDSVTEITPEVIEAYRRKLYHHRNKRSGKPIKFCTQASYLSAIRHWLAWLRDEGWIKSNPADNVQLPKEERRLPSAYLTLDEIETVINLGNK